MILALRGILEKLQDRQGDAALAAIPARLIRTLDDI